MTPRFFALPALLACTLAAGAQYNNGYQQHSGNFYNGVRQGQQGGYYGNGNQYNNQYRHDNDYRHDPNYHQGGIGPGKGALIGAGGGALLGAVFGGGLKGSIIGGAAGAGVGAIVGKEHQNSVRRNDYYGR